MTPLPTSQTHREHSGNAPLEHLPHAVPVGCRLSAFSWLWRTHGPRRTLERLHTNAPSPSSPSARSQSMSLPRCLVAVSLLVLVPAAGGSQSSLRVRDDAV